MEQVKYYPISISDEQFLMYADDDSRDTGVILNFDDELEYRLPIEAVITRPNMLKPVSDLDYVRYVTSFLSGTFTGDRKVPKDLLPLTIPTIQLTPAQQWLVDRLPEYGIPFKSSKI